MGQITPETLHHLVSSVPKTSFKCCEKEWQHYKVVNALLSQLFWNVLQVWITGKDVYLQMTWSWPDKTWKYFVHIVCNEIQVKVNLEITTFFFYLRFPYCPNFFWFGVYYYIVYYLLYFYLIAYYNVYDIYYIIINDYSNWRWFCPDCTV